MIIIILYWPESWDIPAKINNNVCTCSVMLKEVANNYIYTKLELTLNNSHASCEHTCVKSKGTHHI